MKTCPSCRTQYTDDTLRFCLQDGTPLMALPETGDATVSLPEREEETVARARQSANDSTASFETAWKPVGEFRGVPSRKVRSTLAIASLAAAIVLLFLGVAGAIGLWLYFREPADLAINSDNGRGNQNQNLNTNSNLNPTVTPQPTPTAGTNRGIANRLPAPPTPEVDKAQASREVSQAISGWKDESEQGDLNALTARYANSVEYYRRQGFRPPV